jgi:hypothetical protein
MLGAQNGMNIHVYLVNKEGLNPPKYGNVVNKTVKSLSVKLLSWNHNINNKCPYSMHAYPLHS